MSRTRHNMNAKLRNNSPMLNISLNRLTGIFSSKQNTTDTSVKTPPNNKNNTVNVVIITITYIK